MIGPISRTALFSLLVAGGMSFIPLSWAQEAEHPAASAEAARRQMAVRDALQQVQEARLAYQGKKYSDAVEHYRNALAVLPKAPATAKHEEFIRLSLSDALIAKAIDYRSVGRYEEAVSFLKEAQELAPDNKRVRQELVDTSDAVRHNPALTPQHVGDVEEVNRLLTQAYAYSDLGKYTEALASFNAVLRLDPYNVAAQRGKESVENRRSRYFKQAHDTSRARMLAEVTKSWEGFVPADHDVIDVQGQEMAGEVSFDGDLQQSISDALDEMVIPQVVFDQVTLPDVVETLQNQVRRFEAQGIKASRTINVGLNLGSPNTPQYKDIMARQINLNLSQISVKGVLELLASQLGVSYYYTPTGVEISYSGRDFGPLVDRVYTVPPHFFDVESTSSDDEEEDAFSSSGGKMKVRRVNPVQALRSMGVHFPEGATAQYSSSSRRLLVRNTAHNQDMLREMLSLPMDGQKELSLNVIMMEVAEDDIKELGFEWMLDVSLDPRHYLGGGQMLTDTSGLPTVSAGVDASNKIHTPTASMTDGLRSNVRRLGASRLDDLISAGSGSALYSSAYAQKAPGIFSFCASWQTADLGVLMRGLRQNKNVDMLQNPRVLLSPGRDEQVTFANVREFFYPESYTEPQIPNLNWSDDDEEEEDDDRHDDPYYTGSTGMTTVVTPAHPDSFVRFGMSEDGPGGLGPVLQVHHAEISPDGQDVTLSLTLNVNEFEGFLNWGSPIMATSIRSQNTPKKDEDNKGVMLTPNQILQPIIKRYCENTKVTLRDGSVLVLGGLKQAKKVKFEDKVPVIGDLPLVGRLFRSEGEQNERKVMLILVKVDVVDPTGRGINSGVRPSQATDGI